MVPVCRERLPARSPNGNAITGGEDEGFGALARGKRILALFIFNSCTGRFDKPTASFHSRLDEACAAEVAKTSGNLNGDQRLI